MVALGPSDSYLVVSGSRAWWNVQNLPPQVQSDFTGHLDIVKQKGFESILSWSFGLRGEYVGVINFGQYVAFSTAPSVDPGFIRQLHHLTGRDLVFTQGPGGSCIYQPLNAQLPTYWSTFVPQWPSDKLHREISTIRGEKPIDMINCSVVNHEWFFLVRTRGNGDRADIRYNLPDAAATIFMQWLNNVRSVLVMSQLFLPLPRVNLTVSLVQ